MNEIDNETDSQQTEGTARPTNPIPVHAALTNWIQPLVKALVDVEIDEEFIGLTVSSGVPDGLRRVKRYHRNRFDARRRTVLRRHVLAVKAQKLRVRALKEQADDAKEKFRKTKKLSRRYNWNSWALFKFTLIMLSMVVVMGAAATSAFAILQTSSEFVDFPAACLAVSSLVVFGVVATKFGLEQFKSDVAVRWMSWTLSGITLILGLSYVFLLSKVTGGFGRVILTPEMMAESGSLSTDNRALCIHLMWVQMWFEIFSSVTLFAYAEYVHRQHCAPRPETTPESILHKNAWDEAALHLREEESKLEELRSNPGSIRAARNEFVEKAAAMYLARARAAHNQRVALDAKAGKTTNTDVPRAPFVDRLFEVFHN